MSAASGAGSRAVVLGGGGVAGIAWEAGLLSGLADAGIDLAAADLVVGTSAGSVVGVLLRTGNLIGERAQALVTGSQPGSASPAAQDGQTVGARTAPAFDPEAFTALMSNLAAAGLGQQESRAKLGEFAQRQPAALTQEAWLAQIARWLPADWPDGALAVTAVDADTGEFKLFDASSGVPLERAVAASCTVPTVYPLVEIDGHPHMDGGMRSATNADVASGYQRVLVVACHPGAPFSPLGPVLDAEVAMLRDEAEVMLVVADDAATQAFGGNVLDPAASTPAFEAGRAQARHVAEQVRQFWA